MISTGNDIISLDYIDIHRTRQKQFYNKVLTNSELKLYNNDDVLQMPFELFVWLAWSIKESAFKYLKRHVSDLIFSPLKMNIQSIKGPAPNTIIDIQGLPYEATSFLEQISYLATIEAGPYLFHSRSIINQELIYTIVNQDESFRNVWWGIKAIDAQDHKNQSAEVRSFLLKKLQEVLPYHTLSLSQNLHGCPVINDEKKEVNIPVSLTHHHGLVAYSFLRTSDYQKNQAILM